MHPRLFADRSPQRPAVVMQSGETLTYGQLESRANQAAHVFRALGLKAGDCVAIFMENELPYFEICWGAQRAGLYFTPVSSRLTAEELQYIVEDSGAKALVFSASLRDAAVPVVRALTDRVVAFSVGASVEDIPCWEVKRATMPSTPIGDERAGSPMFYSSGTTGRPKGVRYALKDEPATAAHPYSEFVKNVFGFGDDTIYLSPAPLYHAAPISYCMFIQRSGGTAVVMDKFDPEAALRLIERCGVTHSQWAPTMFIRMLKLPQDVRTRYDLSSHRVALHAAAPCPISVKQAMIAWWGPIVQEYYSGTEGVGVTMINSEEALRKPGSVGKPVVGVPHILDASGQELGPRQEGQIYFESSADFSYHNAPEKTASARLAGKPNWATLGDIGYLDEDGYLYLTDRKDFMIVSGGVNIYPQEAENLLATHPKVADIAVFGVPNDEFGEEVKAVVAPTDWNEAGEALAEELDLYCRQHLSPIKCPRSYDFERELPRTDTGKLYKKSLRDRYWAGRATRIG
ncbi:MAG TPA: AMP-binding protein [Caulobacterales bacterium]|nr:AMP-binding protein [Caulobacterales bacterium]